MCEVKVFVIVLAALTTDQVASARTNIVSGPVGHRSYPGQDFGQQSLNTPLNTRGKANHNYFLNTGSSNSRTSQSSAASALPTQVQQNPARLYVNRDQQSANTYRTQEANYRDSDSGRNNYDQSISRLTNGNSRGEETSVRQEEKNSEYQDHQVTFQGTPLNVPDDGTSSHPGFSPAIDQYSFSTGSLDNLLLAVLGTNEWERSALSGQMRQFGNRAMLEEVASDTTGQTRGLRVPRYSYVPMKNECQGYERLRTVDGTCNNLQQPFWGAAFQPFKRYLSPSYADGVGSPRTTSSLLDKQGRPLPLPSPRLISRTVHLIKETTSHVSGLLTQFGQFLDHDITGTSSITETSGAINCCGQSGQQHEACLPIFIPPGDTHFTDSTCINMVRSLPATDMYNTTLVPREQRNEVTSFVDASVVYGSSGDQTSQLRLFQHGLLKTSDGEMLPLGAGGCVAADGLCLMAGDTRVNEMPGLGVLHVLFHRQHNRLAQGLRRLLPPTSSASPRLLDEALFQTARRILIAQLQHVTYTEWLPLVLGPFTMSHYGLGGRSSYVYDSTRDPRVANAVAAAAFRFGHSLVSSSVRWGDQLIPLHRTFNNPSWVRHDVDKLLQGLLEEPAQASDQFVVSGLRNRLFEPEPRKGLDLIAMNIQRGRDHGLPPLNWWREFCGLPRLYGFNDSALGSAGPALREVYLSVDDVDLFTGAVSEPTLAGGLLGATLACLLGRQFSDLKVGDRFFYQTSEPEGFTAGQLQSLLQTSMGRLLCLNTHQLTAVQRNPFLQESRQNPKVPCADLKEEVSLEPWRQELLNLMYTLSQR